MKPRTWKRASLEASVEACCGLPNATRDKAKTTGAEGGEEGFECEIVHAVRMPRPGFMSNSQIYDIHHANLHVRGKFPQEPGSGDRLEGRNIADASEDHVRLAFPFIAWEIPIARLLESSARWLCSHVQPLEAAPASAGNEVHIVTAAERMVPSC